MIYLFAQQIADSNQNTGTINFSYTLKLLKINLNL